MVHAFQDTEVVDDRDVDLIFNPYFISPEQIKDQKPDERSDIYSLGCLLYEMLSGHAPYSEESENPMQVLFAKVTAQPMRTSDDIAPSLFEVVTKATRDDPKQRYQSVDELLKSFLGAVSCES